MTLALDRQFTGPWERRDYRKHPGDVDTECYIVEVVQWRALPRIVHPSVSTTDADRMVAAHNGRTWN